MARWMAGLAVILTLVLSGCAGNRGSFGPEPFTSQSVQSRIQIVVQNRNFAQVRLYAIRRGSRMPLGTVDGVSDREYTLDWPTSEPLQIEINLLAGPTCLTRTMQVDPGDIIELQISPEFSQTRACR